MGCKQALPRVAVPDVLQKAGSDTLCTEEKSLEVGLPGSDG